MSKTKQKIYLKPLDEIIAESNIQPWDNSDFELAAEIGKGLFEDFPDQVEKWRDENINIGTENGGQGKDSN